MSLTTWWRLRLAAAALIALAACGRPASPAPPVPPWPSPLATCVPVQHVMDEVQADLRHAAGDDPVPPGAPRGASSPLYWDAQALSLSNGMAASPLPPCEGSS